MLGKDFRTYALDFWGFGESDGSHENQNFTVNNFVDMVHQFMDKLGIVKAPLIGHSMGGTVSLSTAIRYPEKVVKVVVIGSPIHGSSLNFLLKLSGYPSIASLLYLLPPVRTAIIGSMAENSSVDSTLGYTSISRASGTLRVLVRKANGKRVARPKLSCW